MESRNTTWIWVIGVIAVILILLGVWRVSSNGAQTAAAPAPSSYEASGAGGPGANVDANAGVAGSAPSTR